MSRTTRRVITTSAFGSSAIAALALLASFYVVVNGAVERSTAIRSQIFAVAPGRG